MARSSNSPTPPAQKLEYASPCRAARSRSLPRWSVFFAAAGFVIFVGFQTFGQSILHADDRYDPDRGCIPGAVCGGVAAVIGVVGFWCANRRGGRVTAMMGVVSGLLMAVGLPIWRVYDFKSALQSQLIFRDNGQIVQIGIACAAYAQSDPHGRFPPDLLTLFLAQGPDADPREYVSPLTTATPATGRTTAEWASHLLAGGHPSYVYVGSGLTTASQFDAIVMYEPFRNSDIYRRPVLFADGHVEWFMRPMIEQIVRMDRAGVRPIFWPPHPATRPSGK
jgi:prepilin-type processing-associated H-X9-DG protein